MRTGAGNAVGKAHPERVGGNDSGGADPPARGRADAFQKREQRFTGHARMLGHVAASERVVAGDKHFIDVCEGGLDELQLRIEQRGRPRWHQRI